MSATMTKYCTSKTPKNDFDKMMCQQYEKRDGAFIDKPEHTSATFRECATIYYDLSGPQKSSISYTQAETDGDFQRTHCSAYMDDFFTDNSYHKLTGRWLTGYVDYGMYNGLSTTPKPKSKPPKSPI